MLNTIFALFTKFASKTVHDNAIQHVSSITNHLMEIIDIFEQEYKKDANAKDAALDALCDLIQQHKSNPPAPKA